MGDVTCKALTRENMVEDNQCAQILLCLATQERRYPQQGTARGFLFRPICLDLRNIVLRAVTFVERIVDDHFPVVAASL
jgi:hypothetical protein